jgi:hypothetical protein
MLDISTQLKELAQESQEQAISYQKNYQAVQENDETSRAAIEMKEIDPSLGGMLSYSPIAIFNCLFRPFPWESGKIIIFLNSLESLFLLLATLYLLFKTRFIGFFKIIFNNKYLFFCFITSLLFALIIGFTTYNFGSMARYKIILLPFYYFMLLGVFLNINDKKTIPSV